MSTNAAASRTHPAIIVAAVAVAGFAIVGAAALLGWLPGAKSTTTSASSAMPVQPASTGGSAEYPVPAPAPAEEAKPTAKPAPAAPKAATQSAASAPAAAKPQATKPSYAESAPKPVVASAPPPAPAKAACATCGTVVAVTKIEQPGEGSGLGAVVGGVVGGVLGHQVGGGRGKDVATVVGAAGGAYAGHQIEKSKKATASWDVRVKLEDGSSRVVKFASEPAFRVGDKVKLEGEKLVRAG